jgi:hypothetical protein
MLPTGRGDPRLIGKTAENIFLALINQRGSPSRRLAAMHSQSCPFNCCILYITRKS